MDKQQIDTMIATIRQWMSEQEAQMVGRGHGKHCNCLPCCHYRRLSGALPYLVKISESLEPSDFDLTGLDTPNDQP